jgi:hypothetical protein
LRLHIKYRKIGEIFCIILILFAVCACSASAEKETNPKYTITEGHPRIFLNQDRLDDIRLRCADKRGAQAKYYSVLKGFADKFSPGKSKVSLWDCFALAFLHVVGEVPGYDYSGRSIGEYGRMGVNLLMQLKPPENLDYFMRYTPLYIACYDWLFHAMRPEERAIVFKNFISIADKMGELLEKPIGGRWRETREMYGYYGLAFYGDGKYIYPDKIKMANDADKKAQEYADFYASWWRDQYLAILEAASHKGAYPAGTAYGEALFPDKLWFYDAWATASTDDLYAATTSLTGYPLFFLYQMLPYRTHVRYTGADGRADQPDGIVRYGDYRFIGYTSASRPIITNIAQAQGVADKQGKAAIASVFNWFIQYQRDFKTNPFGGPFPANRWIGSNPSLVWDIIFRNGMVEAKPPGIAGLPLAYHFGAVDSGPSIKPDFHDGSPEGGVVLIRSAWDDPNGTLLWFKASSYPFVHDHRDQGSFQIYKRGWLAIDSGQYEETTHRGNYTYRTVAHNSLLIYRPDEHLDKNKVDPIWYGFANDGGQRWVNRPKTAADLAKPEYFLGGITKFESVPELYDYTQADITRSYNSTYVTTEGHDPKVSLVERSIFFLRPDEYIIVFDRIVSTKAEYPKRWLLHSVYRPELDGKETFEGVIPYSNKISGKPEGVRLVGNKEGGISESRDTNIFSIRGWNFGPSDGRLVGRIMLPENHITRVVGGVDGRGVRKTVLVKPYQGGGSVVIANSEDFEIGDFVYFGKTDKPYSKGSFGKPNWPVDDVFYRGWGKIQNVDRKTNTVIMVPHHFSIPKLPEGTDVLRSNHANANSYEFMNAEYTQWQMQGEPIANGGPYYDQHGSWRIEVEPIEKKTDDVFLNVMLPCDKDSLPESQRAVRDNVKIMHTDKTVELAIKGNQRNYKIMLDKDSPNARIVIIEADKTILDNKLTREAIKARAKRK